MGRATGAMLGLAIGDALGKRTEFLNLREIGLLHADWRQLPLPKKAQVTDDTQMTLALARALRDALADGPLVPLRLELPLREEFVEWWRSPDNNRAPGMTCLRSCFRLSTGRAWQDASDIGSKGCGANMRVAPLGLVRELTDRQVSGASQLQSGLTHGHPTALAASELTAFTVRWLAQGVDPAELPTRLRAHAHEQRTRYDEFWLGDLASRDHFGSPEEFIARGWDESLRALDRLDAALAARELDADPCERTGEGWVAEEAFATALLCFLLLPDDPEAAVRRAAVSSGDSDSLACLAGAFAGARHGEAAWPQDWIDRIEYRDELLAFGALWD
ncbi:ADP-ribosylglycohydrolase family protein [Streptomyces sp. TLI_171]|uniref:ADP-ribosylglycohydrolase family protein n=1 Tax=Streptomyces sp. TLI_171 TaxID=1938859 RepID=UPI000C1845A7|nr:ADP-ribosylglycohydrolase family protein [Streptomyces sp. TLI_171]RKE19579.1 ADP-ribosylglycohydrolase [Streptomyces sp. TLI_171]